MDEREIHEHLYGVTIGGIIRNNPDTGDPDNSEPDDGDNGDTGGDGYTPTASTPTAFSATDLSSMTVSAIRELAAERGYSITATRKADVINEFLSQQE